MKLRWPLMWKSTHEETVSRFEAEIARRSPKWFVAGTRPHSRGLLLELISNDGGCKELQVIVHPTAPTLRPEFHPTLIGCVPGSTCEIVQEPMRTHESEVRTIAQVARKAGDPYIRSDDLPTEMFLKAEDLAPIRVLGKCPRCRKGLLMAILFHDNSGWEKDLCDTCGAQWFHDPPKLLRDLPEISP